MTSCMMSWHHACMCHVTFGYKSSHGASFEALFALVALATRLVLGSSIRFTLGTHVRLVSNACRLQHVWHVSGLEPTSFKRIVLALVNSDVPRQGTWVSQRDPGVPPHSLTVLLPQDCCAFRLVPVNIMVEATPKWTAWLPPRVFRIRCVTYVKLHSFNLC